MASRYQIKQGDTLSKIAMTFGLSSWRDIYYHPDNALFESQASESGQDIRR